MAKQNKSEPEPIACVIELETLPLGPTDGVMVLIWRGEEGNREILFPQLGLLTEGRIEQSVPYMYREIMKARANEGRDLVVNHSDEGEE